jgi:hypothetical protein
MRCVLLFSLLLCSVVVVSAQSQAVSATPKYRARLTSRAEFDRLARTYYQGRFYALPHLMFVIDRAAQNRVY